MRAKEVARNFECGPLIIEDQGFDLAIQLFQRNCNKYWQGLGVETPSHLKVFGHLLFALTQSSDDGSEKPCFFALLPETETSLGSSKQFFVDFFHEYCCFLIVFEMLCSAQRQRKEALKFDPTKPPTNPRFSRSMVDYIREWESGPLSGQRTPFDFYMVFKAMDLFGVEASYTD